MHGVGKTQSNLTLSDLTDRELEVLIEIGKGVDPGFGQCAAVEQDGFCLEDTGAGGTLVFGVA